MKGIIDETCEDWACNKCKTTNGRLELCRRCRMIRDDLKQRIEKKLKELGGVCLNDEMISVLKKELLGDSDET